MANPDLKNYLHHRSYSHGILLPTADTFENVIGNTAGSNKLLLVDLWLWSRDGAGDWKAAIDLCSTVGVPICSDAGITATTTGTDTVGTNLNSGPNALPVPAGLGQQFIRRLPLLENTSLAVKPVGSGSGSKVGLWLVWTVFTDV